MENDKRRLREGYLFLAAFALCIPAANWLIGNAGTTCVPKGPCLIPVAPFGLMAPSGVLMIGLALVLRDLVQRRLGALFVLGAIAAGAVLSATLAPPALVVASGTAFLLSELADFAVYTPLQRRRLVPVLPRVPVEVPRRDGKGAGRDERRRLRKRERGGGGVEFAHEEKKGWRF